MKQIIFAAVVLMTLLVFGITVWRFAGFFRNTKKGFPVKNIGKRIWITLEVAIGQTKIFRRPILGFMHAIVFWGFLVILVGSIEMIIDGLAGTERVFKVLGGFYNVLIASGDVLALLIALFVLVFLFRRLFLHVKRFSGIEMKHISHLDANVALSLIFLLMVTLLGMNTFYLIDTWKEGHAVAGMYPVSGQLAFLLINVQNAHLWHEINWWTHIVLIFFFANYLPYSKHFHVFMSVPNVFLSRLEPLGKLRTMESITKEVRLMLDPNATMDESGEEEMQRFGVLDVQDVLWKNYMDSLACTECGRCTSVCPANITGKKLSPRKIMMDLRARMKEKGPGLVKEGSGYDDQKSLIRDYISEEELWACTTCNACAQECPVNIDHPSLIVDMRRYLVLEESAAPGELNQIFSNIENNGAPWQFAQDDRMNWAENLSMNETQA